MSLKCEFDRAQYLTGQDVCIRLPVEADMAHVHVYCLEQACSCVCCAQGQLLLLRQLPADSYGVGIEVGGEHWEGAFDIVDDARAVTRYAFLSDFSPRDAQVEDVEWIRDLHLNAVQFYDWMYRHDRLIPPQTQFLDPLGRQTDLSVIEKKIEACKQAGIRPIAYGAVYASSEELFREHPEWGMYTMDGKPMTFADWLYYMNVSQDCGWSAHILEEYRQAIALGFSGIHMDTYGFPKQVWDGEGHPVDLAQALSGLIDRAAEIVRREDPDSGVIFNAVNNWPMEAVAKTRQDAVYIEVWPPNERYQDLYTLIRQARLCSGKQVVLAAYLKPFLSADPAGAERAFRLC